MDFSVLLKLFFYYTASKPFPLSCKAFCANKKCSLPEFYKKPSKSIKHERKYAVFS